MTLRYLIWMGGAASLAGYGDDRGARGGVAGGGDLFASPPDHVHPTELSNVAGAILAGRGIADVYGVGTGPTAHASPAYPILLAGVYRIFGFGERGAVAQNVLGWSRSWWGFFC